MIYYVFQISFLYLGTKSFPKTQSRSHRGRLEKHSKKKTDQFRAQAKFKIDEIFEKKNLKLLLFFYSSDTEHKKLFQIY